MKKQKSSKRKRAKTFKQKTKVQKKTSFKKRMTLSPIPTKLFHLNENLMSFILKALKNIQLKEGSILAITSKIVSLSEGRVEALSDWPNKRDLVKREADLYLGEGPYGTHLSINEGLFIASAGIDASNAEKDYYILYPKNPYKTAKEIYVFLKKTFRLSLLGVLITDSHTQPLRRGVTGVGLSYWGFQGVKNMVGEKDLFGRSLNFTSINKVDALASSACLIMGEGNESCPLVLIEEAPVHFYPSHQASDKDSLMIPPQDDLYFPLYQRFLSSSSHKI